MIGWPEILLILVVMLLAFGPDKLPEMAKTLGSAMKEFQKATTDIEKEARILESSLNNLPNQSTIIRPLPRPAVVGNVASAPKPLKVESAPEPAKTVLLPTKDEKNIIEVAKVLGINVEGKSEEDLKIAIHDKIDGIDVKEV